METYLFWGQKIKGQGDESQKRRRGSLHACECWLLLVYVVIVRSRAERRAASCDALQNRY